MKKIFLLVSTALLIVACSNEAELPAPVPQQGAVSMLSFNVGLPAGDPVTYAIQTEAEKSVTTLDIYQFAAGEQGVLEATYYGLTPTISGAGYKVSIGVSTTGAKQFFFVANNAGAGAAPTLKNLANGGIKADAFNKLLTQPIGANKLVSPLMMTAYKAVTVAAGTGTPAQAVELVRIMSRLDIKNFEPNLTLTRVRLERTADRSFVFHQAAGSQNPAGAQFIALPEAALPVTPVNGNVAIEMENVAAAGGISAHSWYKHVFYPYVRDAVTAEADAPLLVIEGTLFKGNPDRETKVVYRKELKVNGQPAFLGFKRNTRYTLVITKAILGELTTSLKVDKWNEESLDAVINVIAPTPTVIFNPATMPAGVATFATPVLTVNKETRTINLRVSSNTEWEVLPQGAATVPADGQMAAWIKAVPVNEYWHSTVAQNIIKPILAITPTANTTGADRQISLVLRSKADVNKQFLLTVKQTK